MSALARICLEHGISQNELVRRTGLARETVKVAYHGRRPLSLETWVTIAKAIPVPLAEICPAAADELRDLIVT